MVGIYNSANTTDFFQLQHAGSASDTIRARTGDSGGTSNGQSATGSVENIFSLGVARFGATNNRVGKCDLGATGTSTGSRTPAGLDRIAIGAQGSSSISAYFDGWISDVAIWNRSLSDAEVFKLYAPETRWELYEPIVRWWTVKGPSGIAYSQSEAGTVTPSGTELKRTTKLQAGTITPAGAINKFTSKRQAGTVTPSGIDAKRTGKPVEGTLTPTGVLVSIRIIINAIGGTLTTAGNLARSTSKAIAGTLTSAGALLKQTSKAQTGTITPAGALVRRTLKALAGTLTPAGNLAKRIAKLLSGALSTVGALATEKQSPAVASVFFTLAPRVTQFTVSAGRKTFTLAERSRDYTLATGRKAFTLAKRVISFTVQDK